jgi:ubiquinone/menaquinone biosynthesis C-methylase UbiE
MKNKSGFQLKGRGPKLYEEIWVPALMGQGAIELVDAAEIRPGETVLDVGCGTGVVTRRAATCSGRPANITGADINDGMLVAAHSFAEQNGMGDIHWQCCDAASMPFGDCNFDAVLCQQGLQFMPDRPAALAEMARVLKTNGRLAVSVWKSESPFGKALSSALDRRFGEGTTAPWKAASSLGDRDELRSLAEAAGFRNCHVRYDVKIARCSDPDAFVWGVISASPLADAVAEYDDKNRRDLIREIVDELENYMDDSGLAYPGECHTLTAQK